MPRTDIRFNSFIFSLTILVVCAYGFYFFNSVNVIFIATICPTLFFITLSFPKIKNYFLFDNFILLLNFIVFINLPGRQLFDSINNLDPYVITRISARMISFIYCGYMTLKFHSPSAKKIIRQRHVLFFIIYLSISTFSCSYSPYPFYSFSRVFEAISLFTISLYFNSKYNFSPRQQLIYIACLSAPLFIVHSVYFIDPSIALKPRYFKGELSFSALGGWMIDPNILTAISSIIFCLSISNIINSKKILNREVLFSFFLLNISTYTFYLSRGRSAVLAAITASLFIIIFSPRNRTRNICFMLYILPIFCILYFTYWHEIFFKIVLKGDSIESLSTATGRFVVWTDLLNYSFPLSPILGHGYQMLGPNGILFNSPNAFPVTMAHNSFLQALIGVGLFGFVFFTLSLFLYMYKSFLVCMHKNNNRKLSIENIAITIIVFFDCVTDYGVGGLATPIMLIFFLYFLQRFPKSTYAS